MTAVGLVVNGVRHDLEVPPHTTLVELLRETLHLRGAKVVLIREDGTTDTKYFYSSPSDQIKVGDTLTFRGSLGTDRIIIVVTTGGKDYKILDEMYEFKSHQ